MSLSFFFFFLSETPPISSTTFTVRYFPSTTLGENNDNLPWATIVLFGSLAFIILAGFLTWLGGRIYVAIFGMPELSLEAIQGAANRRDRPLGENCEEIASSCSISINNCGEPGISGIYDNEEIEQLMDDIRAIAIGDRTQRTRVPFLENKGLPDVNDMHNFDELQRLIDKMAAITERRRAALLAVTNDQPGPSDVGSSNGQLRGDIKTVRTDNLQEESKPGSSKIMYSDELELGDWELIERISPRGRFPLIEDFHEPSLIRIQSDLDDFEHAELGDYIAIKGRKQKAGRKNAHVPPLPVESEQKSSEKQTQWKKTFKSHLFTPHIARHTEILRDRPKLIVNVSCTESKGGLTPLNVKNSYYFAQLPFFWVNNLAYELKNEADLIRKYFMSLLPFYRVENLKEAQMASWEINELVLSDLPFFEVSNEELRDYVYFSRREANHNVEAALLSPKEPLDPCRAMDFVLYEDETTALVPEPSRDSH